ncbi:hypothetical protein D3C77_814480 [compost metagenome]
MFVLLQDIETRLHQYRRNRDSNTTQTLSESNNIRLDVKQFTCEHVTCPPDSGLHFVCNQNHPMLVA